MKIWTSHDMRGMVFADGVKLKETGFFYLLSCLPNLMAESKIIPRLLHKVR